MLSTRSTRIKGQTNLRDTLPSNLDYFMYLGSLTSPPCDSGVIWVVLQSHLSVSRQQLQRFPLAQNFRPPQPLNSRVVFALSQPPPLLQLDDWAYNGTSGPSAWPTLFSSCGGSRQSPIALDRATAVKGVQSDLAMNFESMSQLAMKNDGKKILFDYTAGQSVFQGNHFRVKHVEFHAKSEHRLGGLQFPLEMQIFHRSEGGDILVIAVFFQIGAENAYLQLLGWDSLPTREGSYGPTLTGRLDLNTLLPNAASYFHYSGSLTTPPCTEGVTWVVLEAPVIVSAQQLNKFPFSNNSRPLISAEGRVVYQLSPAAAVASDTSWSYQIDDGPLTWARNFPGCRGDSQSPINIRMCDAQIYEGNRLRISLPNVRVGALVNTGSKLQIDAANGSTIFGDTQWDIVSIEWHGPSGTQIEGEQAPLEMNIVHKSSRAGAQDQLMVLSVLLQIGEPNPLLSSLGWTVQLPPADKVQARNVIAINQKLDVSAALPSGSEYFSYMGSLVEPPCTQGVRWIVLQQYGTVSGEQLTAYRGLFKSNFRGPQPLNARVVEFLSDGSSQILYTGQYQYAVTWYSGADQSLAGLGSMRAVVAASALALVWSFFGCSAS